MTLRSIWNFSFAQDFFSKSIKIAIWAFWKNIRLLMNSKLKEKSCDEPLRIYTWKHLPVKITGYWNLFILATVEIPENPCFCTVCTKTCIDLSQSDSIIIFLWYIISIEKLNTNRTCVLNILLNYDFAFNIGQSNLMYCDKIVTKWGTSCAFFVEWLYPKLVRSLVLSS